MWDGLHSPAVLLELLGQEVQQLGMARAIAHEAEVVRSVDDPFAEVEGPNAVDDDARGERMLRIGEPVCEDQTRILSVGRGRRRALGQQHAQRAHVHSLALVFELAPVQHVDLGAVLVVVGDGGDVVGRGRQLGFELGVLRLLLFALLALEQQDLAAHLLELAAQFLGLVSPFGRRHRAPERHVPLRAGAEESLELVVVAMLDRVELVVVAARTAHGQPEEGRTDYVGALGQHLVARAGHLLVAGIAPNGAQAVKSGGDQQLLVALARLLALNHFVACELLAQELIVWLVRVKGLDDIVAIAPQSGQIAVVLESLGLGKADHIQPVLAPALAVVRAFQQTIDELLPGVRGAVGYEVRDLGWRRRQTGHVEVGPPDQRRPVRLGGRPQLFLIQLRQYEGIDRRAHPRLVRRT